MTPWLVFAALPILVLFVALLNALTWRRGHPYVHDRRQISVLIPARNEEKNIRKALSSVLRAEGSHVVKEILVYDDQSTDSTRRIVREIARNDERIRLLSGGPLPPGWVGKPHALSQLADAAAGEVLIFMDADVELETEGLTRLLSLTHEPVSGRIITAMPQQITGTFFERLVLPLLPLTYLAWLPLRLVEVGSDPRTVAANGQLLVLSRHDYERLGGFETVRNEIVDDVAFCRHAKSSGLKVVFADGSLMAKCRMYDGAQDTISGFSKNLYEGVGGPFGVLTVLVLYLAAFLLPYLGLGLALSIKDLARPLLAASLAGVGANLVLQLLLVVRYRQPVEFILLQPLSILAFCFIALNSWRWQRAGRVTWAGRNYDKREVRISEESPSAHPAPRKLERSTT